MNYTLIKHQNSVLDMFDPKPAAKVLQKIHMRKFFKLKIEN